MPHSHRLQSAQCHAFAAAVTSRLPPLNTSAKVHRSSYQPSSRSRLRCTSTSSDSSPSVSPITPTDTESPLSSGPSFASSSSTTSASSSSGFRFHDDTSDHESNGSSTDHESSPSSPVFSPFPTRQARSATISKTQSAHALAAPNTMSTALPPRRNPSFPVSRPLRPFDSISNAMGTTPVTRTHPSTPSVDSGELEMKAKPKTKRSNVLLEPPKNPRFASGFFMIDMTQEEFKTRAW